MHNLFWSICNWLGFAAIGAVSALLVLGGNIWLGEKLCEMRRKVGMHNNENNKSIYELSLTQLLTRLLFFPRTWKDSEWSNRENYSEYNPFFPLLWAFLFIPNAIWGIIKAPFIVVSWRMTIHKKSSLRAIRKLLKIKKGIAKTVKKFDDLYHRISTQMRQLEEKEWSSKIKPEQKIEAKKLWNTLSEYSRQILWPMQSEIDKLYSWLELQQKKLLAYHENTTLLLPEEIPEEIGEYERGVEKECRERFAEIETGLKVLRNFQEFRKKQKEEDELESKKGALECLALIASTEKIGKETYKM